MTQHTQNMRGRRLQSAVIALIGIVGSGSTAFAQTSQDDEIEALREELATLRTLVEAMAADRDAAASERRQVIEAIETGHVTVIDESPAESGPSPMRPNATSDIEDDPSRLADLLTSRQPIGRFPDDAIVTRGSFDRSFAVPGTAGGAFRIGGNVIVNANYDIDNLGFQDISFQPTIPLDGDSEDGEQQTRIHTRLSRVNIDYREPTPLGEFRTFIEFDFFGDGDERVNDYDLRLRHAVAELGNWKFGQFWSGFMDVFSQPETADPGGPIGLPSKRNPGVFYVRGERSATSFGVGVENPEADLAGRTDLKRSESVPNPVAFGKLQGDWGYVRLAGMGIQLRSKEEDLYTGAAHVSGRLNTPWLNERDNFAFGVQYGEGFAHFYSSFAVQLDGFIDDDGDVEATEIFGAFGAYQHWWNPKWRSSFIASVFDFDLPNGFDPFAYAGGERYTANLVWSPINGVTFGGEISHELIETFDGSEGDGTRLEFVARFDF